VRQAKHWLAAAMIAVILAACGSTAMDGAQESKRVRAANQAPAADLTSGYASLPVPVSPRESPLVLAAGNQVLVYGGYVIERGDEVRPLADGVMYDTVAQQWSDVPPAPFGTLYHSGAAVWTGAEIVIVGTPCGRTAADSDLARCAPGGLVVAAYTPTTRTWRTLPRPSLPLGVAVKDSYTEPVAVGWTGRDAVFSIQSRDPDQSMLLVDPKTGASTWAAALGAAATKAGRGAYGDDPGGHEYCAVDGDLLGFTGASTSSAPIASPPAVFQLDRASLQWRQAPGTARTGTAQPMFEYFFCTAGQLASIPIQPPPTGIDGGGLWWNAQTDRWDPLPSFGAVGFPSQTASVAQVGATRVVWMQGLGKIFLLPVGASAWSTIPTPTTGLVHLQALDGRVLVEQSVVQPGVTPTIGFWTPPS
jgi:hypothetical protein